MQGDSIEENQKKPEYCVGSLWPGGACDISSWVQQRKCKKNLKFQISENWLFKYAVYLAMQWVNWRKEQGILKQTML